jgi:hypothetical protein
MSRFTHHAYKSHTCQKVTAPCCLKRRTRLCVQQPIRLEPTPSVKPRNPSCMHTSSGYLMPSATTRLRCSKQAKRTADTQLKSKQESSLSAGASRRIFCFQQQTADRQARLSATHTVCVLQHTSCCSAGLVAWELALI